MRAVIVESPGGPEQMRVAELPDPALGVDEVLIDVVATAVNRADLLQRQGHYHPPPGASEVMGLECSGRIAMVGEAVTGWAVGDEVCALLTGGGYASRVAVPAGCVMPVPEGVGLVEAASLPEATCTVWSNLFMVGRLRPGETLLIHGGASGIGTAAIQVARAFGARVAVTAGSADKLARCAALGAEVLVNYRTEDFVDRVRTATDDRGADVVLDIIGAKYLDRNIAVLAQGGRLLIIGLQGGRRGDIDLNALMEQRGAVISSRLRARPTTEKTAICAGVVEQVWPLVKSGELQPVIDRVLPLEQAAEAHRVVEAGEHVGKVVLTIV